MVIDYSIGHASKEDLLAHLSRCDSGFVPLLSNRVEIGAYVRKIVDRAERFEAWSSGELVGLVAAYCNASDRDSAFITSVSVLPGWQGKGIASQLMANCMACVRELSFERIKLEVDGNNEAAIALYAKYGFTIMDQPIVMQKMMKDLRKEVQVSQARDYNAEIRDTANHQYAYSFDFDVMHPYMIRSFEPFFRQGSFLELGSFKGNFTRRFLERFEDVTCVEASGEAIAVAKVKLGDKPTYIHSLFETATLPKRYDNIVLTHVLEHLDDPVRVLKRVNEEWLAESGRFFLACPNANAPSRQIAVKMGLISHNAAVTPAEAEHGHRCTYSLDTLERDAVAAGLKVVHRSGIFFKALANFQWDRLLQTDIVSREYLDGCYMLGQQYPDLCSSIFLICEKGTHHG
jgi:GNAT superfamily N-acetyltransferase